MCSFVHTDNITYTENMHTRARHPNLLQFDTWNKLEYVSNFSTTSQGGVSSGNYSSFNLGRYTEDDPLNIDVNYRFLSRMLGIDIENLFVPKQSHGNSIAVIDNDFLNLPAEEKQIILTDVDALITNVKNIGIGVTTADCVPILIHDPQNHAIAAIHAGWRGTVQHIASKTLKKMQQNFGTKSKDVLVGIAPSISAARFEVGDEIGEAFREAKYQIENFSYRHETSGKLHIDLQEANTLDLMSLGVKRSNIENSKLCSYSNPDLFFSARRQTIKSGRMMTGAILL